MGLDLKYVYGQTPLTEEEKDGRHSRIMADIIIESIFGKEVFTWNNSDLVKPDNTRIEYLELIKKADKEIIKPLIVFARS